MNEEEIYRLYEEAYSYREKDELDKAIEIYKKIGSLGEMDAYNSIGYLYQYQKDDDKAIKYYIIASAAGNIYSTLNLCKIYLSKKEYKKVIDAGLNRTYELIEDNSVDDDVLELMETVIKALIFEKENEKAKALYIQYKAFANSKNVELDELLNF